jgi:nuclear transport factor 2 (NTF2) superfamily protein
MEWYGSCCCFSIEGLISVMTETKTITTSQETSTSTDRPPLPPFTRDTAVQKVRMAEDSWNSRNPEKVALGYSPDSQWRNRAEFLTGRASIIEFLKRKWAKELEYRLIKRAVGVYRESHRGSFRVRMAGRFG